jgi:hypothetical protein
MSALTADQRRNQMRAFLSGCTLADCLDAFTLPGDAELATRAQAEHGSDDIEIADPPVTSRADEGSWVLAWVWVANDEEGVP